MGVLTPVFYQGEWVGFCASMAHKSDIGGTVPGSGSGTAREIFQEGLHLPAVKFMDAGRPVRELEWLIHANSRTPEVVVGDIRRQVGANRLGERRMAELLDKYGKATVVDSTEELAGHAERRLRQVIASWPDGRYQGEACVDNDGIDLDKPVRIRVTVEKTGDRILFDFSECSPQTTGPANIRPPLVRACCYCLIALIDPFLPINQGLAPVVETRFRQGTVVCPDYPAAVNAYMPTALVVAEAVLQAMASLVPDKTIAEGSGSGAIALGGRARDGKRSYVQYEIFAGGVGGRNGKDGASATSFHLSNGKIAPVEIIESEFPTQVERFELLRDSGGPGGTGDCIINPGGEEKQLQAVITEYDSALARAKYADGSDTLSRTTVVEIATRCIAAIERIAGRGSAYFRQVEQMRKTPVHSRTDAANMIGIAKALLSDIQNDYLRSFEENLHGDLFGDFLEMSTHLTDQGYKDAAAVLAGSTLEVHLKKLCDKHGVTTISGQHAKKADTLNAELVKVGAYTKLDQKASPHGSACATMPLTGIIQNTL